MHSSHQSRRYTSSATLLVTKSVLVLSCSLHWKTAFAYKSIARCFAPFCSLLVAPSLSPSLLFLSASLPGNPHFYSPQDFVFSASLLPKFISVRASSSTFRASFTPLAFI
ncbi:hypothetical protein CHARACLAT_008848 [Characodon lateralis]|uniref:Uncharacterized protein n=1 Tax=Characodon lateralis TaxID=208331 RepID=A0ABU7DEW7_9TELE|nr:hypothetical protein [Characodon lateralis]